MAQWVKNPLAMQEMQEIQGLGFDPRVGKIPWRKKWQPLQYSCLKNPMDRGAWWATVRHDWATKHTSICWNRFLNHISFIHKYYLLDASWLVLLCSTESHVLILKNYISYCQVPSLFGELRSHMPCGTVKKRKKGSNSMCTYIRQQYIYQQYTHLSLDNDIRKISMIY